MIMDQSVPKNFRFFLKIRKRNMEYLRYPVFSTKLLWMLRSQLSAHLQFEFSSSHPISYTKDHYFLIACVNAYIRPVVSRGNS